MNNDALRQKDTLRQKAYNFIQNKLLEGELRAGDIVSEQMLAAEIGMSRTPVREAIGQLQMEGLFDKVPRVGTIVHSPSQRELSELYEVRQALESHAAFRAAKMLDEDDLATLSLLQRELEEIVAQMQDHRLKLLDEALLRRFFYADISFHMVIVRATNNSHAMQIISEFRVIQRVFEYDRVEHRLSLVRDAAIQHGEILAALRQGDAEAAQRAMFGHIQASCEYALQSFAYTANPHSRNVLLDLPSDLLLHIAGLSEANPIPS